MDRVGTEDEEPEPVDEAFWARRAADIKHLFHRWDCNQMSTAAFGAQIQDLLGASVDVSCEDSEFSRLTSKYDSARNMKFASLMSALRRDAQNTMERKFGRPCLPQPSCYGASYAGSTYEPSEVGSEVPSCAAGRPSGSAITAVSRAGRRHFAPVESNVLGSHGPSNGSHLPRAARAPPPFATIEDVAPVRSRRAGQQAPRETTDWPDSVSVATDTASVADSMREVFIMRNRTGHGNILAWGDGSRSLTPQKARQGRQLAVDPEQGIPRSHKSSGIFSHK